MKRRLQASLTSRYRRCRSLFAVAFAVFASFAVGPAGAAHTQVQPQAQTAAPTFEVASVKPSLTTTAFPKFAVSPERFSATAVTASELIGYAYKVRDFQIKGAPEWAKAKKFDIDAKVRDSIAQSLEKLPRGQQIDALRIMVQSLLANRFELKATRQTKTAPIYALVVAKGGPKLPQPAVPPLSPEDRGRNWQNLTFDQITTAGLASFLGSQRDVARVVVDQTGVTGKYDITLRWSSDTSGATGAPGMTIFEALQDQLGLKLQSEKGPVETFIVDHIEQPAPN